MNTSFYPRTVGRVYWNPAYPSFRQNPTSGTFEYGTGATWAFRGKTPNYERAKRERKVLMNALKVGEIKVHRQLEQAQLDFRLLDGTLVCIDQYDVREGSGLIVKGRLPDIDPENFPDYQALLASALSEANSGSVDLLTSLMEAHESVDMIISAYQVLRHPLKKFGSLRSLFEDRSWPFVTGRLQKLKRKNARQFSDEYIDRLRKLDAKYRNKKKTPPINFKEVINDVTNAIAELDLTWRYGVMPNVYLFQDAVRCAKKATTPSFLEKARKIEFNTLDQESPLEISSPQESPGNVFHPYGTYTRVGSELLKVTVTSIYKYDTSLSKLLKHEFDFNVVKTAWELVPFSFVVDWFVQIGDWLGQFFTPSGLVDRMVCVSWKVSYVDITTTSDGLFQYPFGPNNTQSLKTFGTSYSSSREFAERRIVTGELAALRFNVQLNWKRAADAAALFKLNMFR